MSRSTLRTVLLLSLGVPTAATGAWAVLAPSSWHSSFPGFGRDWLPAFGPYNEHLARDFGGALLALGVLLVWAGLAGRSPSLRRAVPAAFLLFALPHFVFHLANAGELPAADEVVNLVTLGLTVVVPLALLLMGGDPRSRPRSLPAGAGTDGWRLPPARPRGPVARLAYRISRRRYGHVIGPIAITAHSPMLLAGYSSFELALERAERVEPRLKDLATLRAATRTGCPFCIDFGSALLADAGLSAEKLGELQRWRQSDAFSEDEQLVLEYAEGMSRTPVEVSDELFERLRKRFDEAALVELTTAIAFEHYRGRFNHAMGIGSEGFCELPGNGRQVVEAVA